MDGAKITPGSRYAAAVSMAGAMRNVGAEEAEITAALLVLNETRFDPPKPEDEIKAVAADIAERYGPAEVPWTARLPIDTEAEEPPADGLAIGNPLRDAKRQNPPEPETV